MKSQRSKESHYLAIVFRIIGNIYRPDDRVFFRRGVARQQESILSELVLTELRELLDSDHWVSRRLIGVQIMQATSIQRET